jgi:hypothetical protein
VKTFEELKQELARIGVYAPEPNEPKKTPDAAAVRVGFPVFRDPRDANNEVNF